MDVLIQNPQYTERMRYLLDFNDYIGERINDADPMYSWGDILYNLKCIDAMEQEMLYGKELPRLDI